MDLPFEFIDSELKCKVVFFGEPKVGKTSVITRYCKNVYYEDTESTYGNDIYFKNITIDNKEIKYIVWDTSLTKLYRKIAIKNFNDADVIVLIYQDGDNSFKEIKDFWYPAVKETMLKGPIIRLIKSKCDENVVVDQTEEEMMFIQEKCLSFRRVSARDNISINELFSDIGKAFISKMKMNNIYD